MATQLLREYTLFLKFSFNDRPHFDWTAIATAHFWYQTYDKYLIKII